MKGKGNFFEWKIFKGWNVSVFDRDLRVCMFVFREFRKPLMEEICKDICANWVIEKIVFMSGDTCSHEIWDTVYKWQYICIYIKRRITDA